MSPVATSGGRASKWHNSSMDLNYKADVDLLLVSWREIAADDVSRIRT